MEEIIKRLRLQKIPFLVIPLVLVAGLGAGYYIYNQNNAKNTVPEGWVEYKNDKYSLRFIYPKVWGEATLTDTTAKKGKQYNIAFRNNGSSGSFKNQVGVTMQTNDYLHEVCQSKDKCITLDRFDSGTVYRILKADKEFLAKYDTTSYATVKANTIDSPVPGLSSSLDYYQVVNLHKINVSAVHVIYSIPGTNRDCPLYKLSVDSENKCVTQRNYQDLVSVVKSIKTLE